jgi:hypothetical protein
VNAGLRVGTRMTAKSAKTSAKENMPKSFWRNDLTSRHLFASLALLAAKEEP